MTEPSLAAATLVRLPPAAERLNAVRCEPQSDLNRTEEGDKVHGRRLCVTTDSGRSARAASEQTSRMEGGTDGCAAS
jgi:hypothetical protein